MRDKTPKADLAPLIWIYIIPPGPKVPPSNTHRNELIIEISNILQVPLDWSPQFNSIKAKSLWHSFPLQLLQCFYEFICQPPTTKELGQLRTLWMSHFFKVCVWGFSLSIYSYLITRNPVAVVAVWRRAAGNNASFTNANPQFVQWKQWIIILFGSASDRSSSVERI